MLDLVAAPTTLTAAETASLIATRELSPVEAVKAALDRAPTVHPHLNCFTAIWADEALDAAFAGKAFLLDSF